MKRGMKPGSPALPWMVCVLPLPVCPYAKLHASEIVRA